MRALLYTVGLWYVAVGALMVFDDGGGVLRFVVGVLFAAEGATVTARAARAARGDADARRDVRWSCWAVLTLVGAVVAAWVYSVLSGGVLPEMAAIAVEEGVHCLVAVVVVPAVMPLLVLRRRARIEC
ncbi:hypothetical protein [Streptomyces thermolilacinus]|uniref:Uncharacterized protein n=1 Tax=Streptomyces thermolilacinus SPC6 TaxID=1306406 RepID=A0A1D3DTP0_9ACTN|nr:hypothetical protein [Streptomyces thermolilacinus]OEJ95690.1 hypothetical protein J116_015545 [Streptomyces thermolilacinus SPC6]